MFAAHALLVGFGADAACFQPLLVVFVVAELFFDDAVEGAVRQAVAAVERLLLEQGALDEAAHRALFEVGFAEVGLLLLDVAVLVLVGAHRDFLAIDGGDVRFAAVVKVGHADKEHADTGDDDEQIGDSIGFFFADVFEHGSGFRGKVKARILSPCFRRGNRGA